MCFGLEKPERKVPWVEVLLLKLSYNLQKTGNLSSGEGVLRSGGYRFTSTRSGFDVLQNVVTKEVHFLSRPWSEL